jgi:hypothetical protein
MVSLDQNERNHKGEQGGDLWTKVLATSWILVPCFAFLYGPRLSRRLQMPTRKSGMFWMDVTFLQELQAVPTSGLATF